MKKKSGKSNVGNMLKAKTGTKQMKAKPGGKKKASAMKKQRPYSQ